jgi:hypothetical protein
MVNHQAINSVVVVVEVNLVPVADQRCVDQR